MGGQLSNLRVGPTIHHERLPTLAEQKQRIPAWISERISVVFGHLAIGEGDLWSVFASYIYLRNFPWREGFYGQLPTSLPPVAGKWYYSSYILKPPLDRRRYPSGCPGRRHLQNLALQQLPLRQ